MWLFAMRQALPYVRRDHLVLDNLVLHVKSDGILCLPHLGLV